MNTDWRRFTVGLFPTRVLSSFQYDFPPFRIVAARWNGRVDVSVGVSVGAGVEFAVHIV